MRLTRRRSGLPTLLGIAILAALPTVAQADGVEDLEKLARSSLEDLMKVQVASVSGTPQTRLESPAAVYVITGEDLRRSGHRSLAAALRMVPGMNVSRTGSASWVVGARGLSGSALTATRYLVLVDGRQVYDPLISVTQWDTVDTALEDVDRIEVIRGPGATLWGANAMNGVINILTKPAAETTGTLVQASVGNRESDTTVRYGATTASGDAWRLFGKFGAHDATRLSSTGESRSDAWSSARVGLRYDRETDPRTLVSVFADAYALPRSSEAVRVPVPGANGQFSREVVDADVDGASLMLRINRGWGEESGWRLRAYLDHTRRDRSIFSYSRDTADLDLRLWQVNGRHAWVWGGEWLMNADRTEGTDFASVDPADRRWNQANLFVQDTITLVPNKLFAMVGTKLTWHEFVGLHLQPNLRLWWTPDTRQTVWASLSRPMRTPSRFEENGRLLLRYEDVGAAGEPEVVPRELLGDASLEPEQLLAWELGYRFQPGARSMVEAALFYNDYQRLIEPAPTVYGPWSDEGSGKTWGVELNASAQVTDRWRVEASWSALRVDVDGPVLAFEETASPRRLAQVRSYLELGEATEFNLGWYHTAGVEGIGTPAYNRLDLGLAWRVGERTRLELWGQNLLESAHRESSDTAVPRSVFARMTVQLGGR
jgi:iron complex outermembrane receptor protein